MEPGVQFAEGRQAGSKLRAGQSQTWVESEIGGRGMVGSDLEAGSELGVWAEPSGRSLRSAGAGAWANGPGSVLLPRRPSSPGLWAERAVEKKPNSGRPGRRGRGLRAAGLVQEIERLAERSQEQPARTLR